MSNSESDQPPYMDFFDQELSEEELTKRQWQILEAAIKIFAEKGFEASRTSEIAKEASVAEGTIFRYYKTKKDLLLGLLFPLMTKFFRPMMFSSVERIMRNKEDLPVEQVLKDIYLDRLQLVRKNAPLIKTIAVEAMYHPELLKPLREELAPKIYPLIDHFIEKEMEQKQFRELDSRLVTRTLMSLVVGYVLLTSIFPDEFPVTDDEQEIEKMVDILLNGIAHPSSSDD